MSTWKMLWETLQHENISIWTQWRYVNIETCYHENIIQETCQLVNMSVWTHVHMGTYYIHKHVIGNISSQKHDTEDTSTSKYVTGDMPILKYVNTKTYYIEICQLGIMSIQKYVKGDMETCCRRHVNKVKCYGRHANMEICQRRNIL